MSANRMTTQESNDRDLVYSRIFDAPRDRVFAAWTDPGQAAEWWGPKGFRNTIHEMDARPGGTWRLTMHGPDGADYPNRITYLEVEKPSRLVYEHGEDEGPARFHVTAAFSDREGKTLLNMTVRFRTRTERDETKKFAIEGLRETLDRLEAYLAKMG